MTRVIEVPATFDDRSFEQFAASVEAAVTTAIRRAVTRDDGSRAAGA